MPSLPQWIRPLLSPEMGGMDDTSLRAHWVPFLGSGLILVGLAICRYLLGILDTASAQGPTVLLGLLGTLTLFGLVHGRDALARIPWRSWAMLGGLIGTYFFMWYVGRSDAYDRYVGPMLSLGAHEDRIASWAFFCLNNGLFLVLPGVLIARACLGMRLGALGFSATGGPARPTPHVGRVYGIAFAVVLPFILVAATNAQFIARYPMYRRVIGADNTLLLWELALCGGLYLAQFAFVEAFFRGVFLFSLERSFGLYALALANIPYVTGHFGKPMPEALGAILTGWVLGWFALKHRSFWYGALVHIGVALVMDVMALWGRGTILSW